MFVSIRADRVTLPSLSTLVTDRVDKLGLRFVEWLEDGAPPTLFELDKLDEDFIISRRVREVLGGGLDDRVRLTDRCRGTGGVRLVDRVRRVTGGRLLLVERDLMFVVEDVDDDLAGPPPLVFAAVPVTAMTLSLRDTLEDLLRFDVVLAPLFTGPLLDGRR